MFVPDPYDLAASKLLRGNEHDREQLRELHAIHPLSFELLMERCVDLLADYVGDPTEPRCSTATRARPSSQIHPHPMSDRSIGMAKHHLSFAHR